jgi:hypothetical protein
MEEEQVEILFTSLFDGFALFRGSHWKIREDEKHIIPALTRILNRMLEALPKGISDNAFNIMDYVIVIGAIGAMIMSRMQQDKGGKQIARQTIADDAGKTEPISDRNENDFGGYVAEPNGSSWTEQRNEDGFSSIPPIKDLAQSITRIS